MARGAGTATKTSDRELVITRLFDAPRSLVFRAWTEPEHLVRWWGPFGFNVVSCEMNVRLGGAWRFCMRSANVDAVWQRGVYREIVEPERLVFSYAFEDASGKPGHETLVTVDFAEDGGKTKITLHQAVFESQEVRDDHVRGWTEALNRLAGYVAQS
jgi:uncharacterized protein YndB with AHSA1/START domain